MVLKPIDQQVVVIVGASSGIGREAALRFARGGAKVVVAARDQAGLDTVVQQIQQQGGDAIAISADVADFEQVQAIADKAVAAYGRLDTWVNAAAVGVMAMFEEMTLEEFQRVIQVTLMGQVYGAKAALPYLKREGRGALIFISSMEGRRSLPLQSAYSTAKHGVEGFAESLRVELRHQGLPISVTTIQPAVINTPFYNHARTHLGVKPTGIPPYYSPGLVAEAILHVAAHPTRNFIVGDVGRILDLLQRLSPALVDELLLLLGFQFQRTQEPKSPEAGDSLYAPMPEQNRVEGDFSPLTVPSLSDWLAMNPRLTWGAVAGIAVGVIGLLAIATYPDQVNR